MGLAHGELEDADVGGCGASVGLELETVVSFVDRRRDEGAAMGTGELAGRPTCQL